MKNTLLALMLPLLQIAAIQAADVGAEACDKLDIQVISVQKEELLEPGDKGKEEVEYIDTASITYNGRKILSFNIKDLEQSKTLQNLMQDMSASHEKAIALFLQDLNDHQIRLLIEALSANSDQQSATDYINRLSETDAMWLYDQANFWDIDQIYNACAERFARDIKSIDTGLLAHNGDLCDTILRNVNFGELNDCVDKRLRWVKEANAECHDVNPGVYLIDDNRVLIRASKRVLTMYRLDIDKQEDIFRACEDEQILDVHVIDSNRVFIQTDNRVIMHTIDRGTQEDIVKIASNSSVSDVQVIDGNRVLIQIGTFINEVPVYRIIMHTINAGTQEEVFEMCNRKGVHVVDSNRVLLVTDKRVIMRILDTGEQEEIFMTDAGEYMWTMFGNDMSVMDNNRVLIRTNRRVILHELNTGKQDDIFRIPLGNQYSGLHIIDSNRILIRTDKQVILHAMDMDKQENIFNARWRYIRDEYIRNAYVIDSNRVLIRTDERVVLHEINTGNQKDIYKGFVFKVAVINSNRVLIGTYNGVIIYILDADKQEDMACTSRNIKGLYVINSNKMLVETNDKVILFSIFDDILKSLTLWQLQLMYTALDHWKKDKPYKVEERGDCETYLSLPKELQNENLFDSEDLEFELLCEQAACDPELN